MSTVTGIAFLGNQFINDFKIILHPSRPANLLSVVGITDGFKAIPSAIVVTRHGLCP